MATIADSRYMEPRIDFPKTAPGAYMAMRGLEAYVRQCGLEPSLLDLVKTRASQLNGCAYCIDMHTKDARARGETEQRLYALSAWRETPFFSDRERAALEWTEAVTLVADGPIDDDDYEAVRQHFDDKALVEQWANAPETPPIRPRSANPTPPANPEHPE